ncbi:MAG TPA: zinc dependent phospholipase C family protein [Anaerolineales bacterium]|nr:zinc dependent phospholipase C family protein [Anaerolineales bacterium]
MGTWLSHLRIADQLLDRIAGLDPEMFAIGSIGPDSGLPDAKWENFDPPKEISHFQYMEGASNCADLDFYRLHVADVPADDTRRYSFLLGYFFHLVTDNLWLEKIWRPHKAKYPDWIERDRAEFNTETKRDWYGQDFLYLRDHPDSFFHRVYLPAEYDENYLDFMSPAAFAHQLDYIKTFYQRTDEGVQKLYEREYVFLTKAQMDRFVDEAVVTLGEIYLTIIVPRRNTGSNRTSLKKWLDGRKN